jgi:ergothioneine biosynthesis protein EgtB
VTNNDWLRFIDDGGYEKYEYWLSDGWELVNKYKIKRPLYWIDNNHYFDLSGVNKINKDLPVSHISYYEANAFANYLNKRLPSEHEVEFVLKNTQENGIFLEDQTFKEVSYNNKLLSSSFSGNLWVWTSSNYNPYKGYESLKLKANEYNSKFMCNQFVLKGGSFATPRDHIRPSYRNFYYPSDRWQFSGLRLVEDLN